MFERQILGIRSGGFDGADSNFGEDGENRLNTEGATILSRLLFNFCLVLQMLKAELQQVIVQTQRSNPDTIFLKSKKRWNRSFLANETL